MENLNFVLLISRWFHIGAAIVAIGGAVFSRFALHPGAVDVLDEQQRQRLRNAVSMRWARLVHACIALLLITGALNFWILALRPGIEPMPYHALFGFKFLMALAVFFLATAVVGKSPGFANMRANARRWLGVIVVLGALIVLLSGVLNQVRTGRTPARPAGSATAQKS